MTVIDTSPAIHLHATLPGGLASLPQLIGEVVVPFEVGRELAAGGEHDETWTQIQNVPQITLSASPVRIQPLLAAQLDASEAAVIQTALDEEASAVILDERKARRVARAAGLAVTGTLGILVQAKKAARLHSVRDAVDALRQRGIWLDETLIAEALALAGEQP